MADILTNRSAADFANLDLYLIASGTNDFGAQTPIGTIADAPGAATFYGAIKRNIETIRGWKKTLRMAMIAPGHRGDEYTAFPGGIQLRDYCDAIIQCGAYYSVPVYDLSARLGVGPGNFDAYMTQNDGFNNLHYAAPGGVLYGRQVARWLEELGCDQALG